MRLVDLVVGLSRLADLGFGLPQGTSLRAGAVAGLLARKVDLADEDARAALYTALLSHVGCVGYAHETARTFGDEHHVNLAAERTDRADPRRIADTLIPRLVRGQGVRDGVRTALTGALRGQRFGRAFDTASCEVGRDATRRLGLSTVVQQAVFHSSEWWNGGGSPKALAGDDVPVGARVAAVASIGILVADTEGVDAAVHEVRLRRGGMLDPGLADTFVADARDLLGELDAGDPYDVVLDAEPRPFATVLPPRLIEVARVFGDLGDVKIPHTYGHARSVATLARDAGQALGVATMELDRIETAGLLHDVGRVAISNVVWERPGPLRAHEWEQVRLHAYHSERIVSASRELAPLAPLVGLHHERCDGSGYHRGIRGRDLPEAAGLIAAADAYQAMIQPRPYRPALAPEEAAGELTRDGRSGRMDPEVVRAVLAAAGHEPGRVERKLPAGLTPRELEVLRLVAEGCSNKLIATRLVISRRTAEDHVQRIYVKIGASSRAAAAMFAMEHDLLDR